MSDVDKKLKSLFWSDSTISNYSYNLVESVFHIELNNYLNSQLRISFFDVDYSFTDDPTYISNAKFTYDGNYYVIELLDDDGLVLKLKYSTSEVTYI